MVNEARFAELLDTVIFGTDAGVHGHPLNPRLEVCLRHLGVGDHDDGLRAEPGEVRKVTVADELVEQPRHELVELEHHHRGTRHAWSVPKRGVHTRPAEFAPVPPCCPV